MSINLAAIIPAHLASVRFPRKVLFPLHGLPMIEHVRRRALLSDAVSQVVVATCDEEIADTVRRFDGSVVMTASSHVNGTSRVAEAVGNIQCSHVMLLQGDEPLLLPDHLSVMAKAIAFDPAGDAWNATGPIESFDELDRHSFVKCAVGPSGRVLFCFRRSPCFSGFPEQQTFIRKILGIIAFRKDFLQTMAHLPSSAIEQAEFIEQMRIIENGFNLQSVPVSPSVASINERPEVEIVMEFIRRDPVQRKLLQQILT